MAYNPIPKKTDDAAFTPATDEVVMAGYEFDDTAPDSIDEGDAGAARMSARREIYTQIRDAAGNERGLNVDGNGEVGVSAIRNALPAGNNNIGDVDVASSALPTGASTSANQTTIIGHLDGVEGLLGTIDTDTGVLAGAVSGAEMQVDVVAPLPAGTNNIGDVDVLTLPNVAQATAANLKCEPAGNVAHDAADSGNPIKIGAKVETSLEGATLAADGDRTDLYADADGVLLTREGFPLGDLTSEAVSNTDGASTAFTNFGAVVSVKNYITAIHVFRTDAGTTPIYVDFRDGTAGSVLFRAVIPPNGGMVIANGGSPLFKTTANTALAFDVSAATTTVYINVSGFQSKA